MPYADPEKQRAACRQNAKKWRAKNAGTLLHFSEVIAAMEPDEEREYIRLCKTARTREAVTLFNRVRDRVGVLR